MRDLLSNTPDCYVRVGEFLTGPLEYKCRVIFLLVLGVIFVLYEEQLDKNGEYWLAVVAMWTKGCIEFKTATEEA